MLQRFHTRLPFRFWLIQFFLGYKHAKALLKQLELTITAASEQTLADYINKKMGEPADKLKKVAKTKLCKGQPANTWAAL